MFLYDFEIPSHCQLLCKLCRRCREAHCMALLYSCLNKLITYGDPEGIKREQGAFHLHFCTFLTNVLSLTKVSMLHSFWIQRAALIVLFFLLYHSSSRGAGVGVVLWPPSITTFYDSVSDIGWRSVHRRDIFGKWWNLFSRSPNKLKCPLWWRKLPIIVCENIYFIWVLYHLYGKMSPKTPLWSTHFRDLFHNNFFCK